MRYLILPLALFGATLLGCETAETVTGSPGSPYAHAGDTTPVSGSAATLVVNGMSCPLCVTNLDKQLLRMPGVLAVQPNLNDGRVLVTVKPLSPPTRGELAKAVHESGFTLIRIEDGAPAPGNEAVKP